MPVDNGAKIVGEIRELRRSLDDLVKIARTAEKVAARAVVNVPTPSPTPEPVQSTVLAEVPVVLDWTTPEIKGAALIENNNGLIVMTIVIDREETDRTIALVDQLEIGSLVISVYGASE